MDNMMTPVSAQSRVKEQKIVLLGDAGVGKSSIIQQFTDCEFNTAQEPTLGAAFISKMFTYNGKQVKFQIWDTAGQEKYKSLAPLYYRDASVAILVYDITSAQSFDVMKQWAVELKNMGPKQILLAVVGNKTDMKDQEQIGEDAVKSYATDIGALFMTTSAKENVGIVELFTQIAEELDRNEEYKLLRLQQQQSHQHTSVLQQNPSNLQSGNQGRCCLHH